VSRKIFTYFQWGVETNLAKIPKHNTVQGYNSEENPFKIILFLCFRRILVRSATFDSHPAARGRSWIPLGNWRHVVSDEQFLTSPFLPVRFHLFSHQLKFFEGALRAHLGPPDPGHLPRLPRPFGGPEDNNNNNNNNNKHDNVYGAVIMAEPLREFTRFISWM